MRTPISLRLLVLVLALALSGLAGCGGEEGPSSNSTSAAVGSAKGDTAPDFTLARLDGSPLTLSDLRGKAVMIDFWDTWCPPCRRAMPHLQELSQEYGDDLVVVGVAFGREGKDKVASFVQDFNLTFEMVLWEESSSILQDFGGIQSIPTTFLIDADGIVREKWVGAADKASYEAAIVAAIGN